MGDGRPMKNALKVDYLCIMVEFMNGDSDVHLLHGTKSTGILSLFLHQVIGAAGHLEGI